MLKHREHLRVLRFIINIGIVILPPELCRPERDFAPVPEFLRVVDVPEQGSLRFFHKSPERFPALCVKIRHGKGAAKLGLALKQLDAVAAAAYQTPGV